MMWIFKFDIQLPAHFLNFPPFCDLFTPVLKPAIYLFFFGFLAFGCSKIFKIFLFLFLISKQFFFYPKINFFRFRTKYDASLRTFEVLEMKRRRSWLHNRDWSGLADGPQMVRTADRLRCAEAANRTKDHMLLTCLRVDAVRTMRTEHFRASSPQRCCMSG